MSLLEKHVHFRGCYVQASMEDVSISERRPHFRGCYVQDPRGTTKDGNLE